MEVSGGIQLCEGTPLASWPRQRSRSGYPGTTDILVYSVVLPLYLKSVQNDESTEYIVQNLIENHCFSVKKYRMKIVMKHKHCNCYTVRSINYNDRTDRILL